MHHSPLTLPEPTPDVYASARTVLRNNEHPVKIAVLEISSRACKLLIADIRELQQGFTWDAFQNAGRLTNLGMLLTKDKRIPLDKFEESVLPHIEHNLKRLKAQHVDHVYLIATAALRQAQNHTDIVRLLQTNLGMNLQILTQQQEGHAAALGYHWNPVGTVQGNHILIDQGGGSTEILGYNEQQPMTFAQPPSLPMGTSTAVQWIQNLGSSSISTAVDAFRDHFRKTCTQLTGLQEYKFVQAVGMGSALTQSTKKNGNRNQHGAFLTRAHLNKDCRSITHKLEAQFASIDKLSQRLTQQDDNADTSKLSDQLAHLMGATMMDCLLEELRLDNIVVNGLGLRYGICKQILMHLYPNLQSGQYNPSLLKHSIQVDSIQEGSYTLGKVTGIAEFGAFVQLPDNHVGLLHKRSVPNIRLRALRGRPIRVKIRSIFQDNEGVWRFDLTL